MFATVLAAAAGTWGVVMALAPLLQVRRIMRERSSRDVSVGYFVLLLVGFLLWLAHGLTRAHTALVVANSAAFVIAAATIIVALRYRRQACNREI